MALHGLNLRLVRTKSEQADDANPNTTPPSEAVVYIARPATENGGRTTGFRGKVEFAASQTCNIQLWVRNKNAADTRPWSRAGLLTNVIADDSIGSDDVEDGDLYFQVLSRTDASALTIWAAES